MKKRLLIFIIINLLPILIIGLYLYINIGGAENVKEVVRNSPFKEFIYIDHKTIMMLKDIPDVQNMPEFYKKTAILINGVYIGKYGSFGIKMPLGFITQFILGNFTYYKGVLIANPNQLDIGEAEVNDLVYALPSNYKDVLIYRKDCVIGVYYDVNLHRTCIVNVSRKPYSLTIDTEKLKEEILNKTKATDCNVVDMGNKLYIYLEFSGIDLNLKYLNPHGNTNLNSIDINPKMDIGNINNQKVFGGDNLYSEMNDKIKNKRDYYEQQLNELKETFK
jgi:hypothetical protein